MNLDWHYVEDWANAMLALARERNDGDLSLEATCRLRGRIETLKELLMLPTTKQSRDASARIGTPE